MERIQQALVDAVEQRKKNQTATPFYIKVWLWGTATMLLLAGIALWLNSPLKNNRETEIGVLEIEGVTRTAAQAELGMLTRRVDELAGSIDVLESRVLQLRLQVNSMPAASAVPDPQEPANTKHALPNPGPARYDDAAKDNWVVNLASLPSKNAADRFSRTVQKQGVDVQQQRVKVKGRPFWRIQVADFRSAEDARSFAGSVGKKLGLKDVWISRR